MVLCSRIIEYESLTEKLSLLKKEASEIKRKQKASTTNKLKED